jgi:tetratricopeptide (TPR) repeat protein
MSDTFASPPNTKARFKRGFVLGFWTVLVAVLIGAFIRAQSARELQSQVQAEIPWDEQLLACNSVFNAAPSDDFSTCLKMAEEGWIDAVQRVAWAYSRDGEHQDWQASYDWLIWLSDYDSYAELLSYIVLFEIGESKDVKANGERGIRKMAIINNPAATAYLAALYYLGKHQLPQQSNIAWLLERTYAQDKYWVMPEEIAKIYANGFLGKAKPEKAKALLLEATDIDFPLHANNVAWFLATTDYQQLSDTKLAVELAEQVVAEQEYAENYVYVDTLAAAYAADGKYEEAVQTQERALALIKSANEGRDTPSPEIADFEERLALFKRQQPYMAQAEEIDGDSFFETFKTQIEQALIDSLYVELSPPKMASSLSQ